MEAGTLITDRLRLVRPLGQGGMGRVWVAEHRTLQTEVAVKFLSPEIASIPAAKVRFEREARAAARIKSPHVIKIFDHGFTDEGLPFISMELLEGEDFSVIIQRSLKVDQAPLPPPYVRQILTQAALGLDAAHQLELVHRDIKPSNLFVSPTNGGPFVYLLDFGVVKHLSLGEPGLTTGGESFGTPAYMSPEQFLRPQGVDYRSDLWSLAVVAYEALTGALPFEGETPIGICTRISEGRFTPPSKMNPELPPALDAWCERALSRDPEARFPSVSALVDAFSVAQRAGAAPTRPVPIPGFVPAAPAPSITPATGSTTNLSDTVRPAVTSSPVPRPSQSPAAPWLRVALLGLAVLGAAATLVTLLWKGFGPSQTASRPDGSAVRLGAPTQASTQHGEVASHAPALPPNAAGPAPANASVHPNPLASAHASATPGPHASGSAAELPASSAAPVAAGTGPTPPQPAGPGTAPGPPPSLPAANNRPKAPPAQATPPASRKPVKAWPPSSPAKKPKGKAQSKAFPPSPVQGF